jgi:hypothetical protein
MLTVFDVFLMRFEGTFEVHPVHGCNRFNWFSCVWFIHPKRCATATNGPVQISPVQSSSGLFSGPRNQTFEH